MPTEEKDWEPPFPGMAIEDLECPECEEEGTICVRDKDAYEDDETVEAYCEKCHTPLTVQARVTYEFGNVQKQKIMELVEEEEESA